MTDQSGLQSFIQKMQGTHTAGQANTPSSVNNGNPNTVYNWSSYKPTVTEAGGRPSVNFDLITSQAPASSLGYATPFTADPYAAMLLAGMPQARDSGMVNQILGRMFGGGGGGGGTFVPNPSTGGPTGPSTPVTPPGSGAPTAPSYASTGPGAGAGASRPVGPISGPIAANPHNWQANYANANNVSQNATGRQGALPWASMPEFQQAANQPSTGDSALDGLRTALSGLGSTVKLEFKQELNQLLSDLSGKNGWQGFARQALDAFLPGLGSLIPQSQNESTFRMSAEEEAAITGKLNAGLSSMLNSIKNSSGADALARLQAMGMPSSAGQMYNSAGQYSPREWQRLQEQFNFANMFQQGRAGDIGQQLEEEALAKVEATRDKWKFIK